MDALCEKHSHVRVIWEVAYLPGERQIGLGDAGPASASPVDEVAVLVHVHACREAGSRHCWSDGSALTLDGSRRHKLLRTAESNLLLSPRIRYVDPALYPV